MEENSIWLQLILGVMVLIPSVWTICKQYYDRFKIGIIVNKISLGIHEWDNGDRYEVRFFLPIEIFNLSKSIGLITGFRLKIKYHIMGPIYYCEYLYGECELCSEDEEKFDFNARGNELSKIINNELLSFVLNENQSCNKHILFRVFWNKLRVVDNFQITLEIQLNNRRWKKYKEWMGHLCEIDYRLYKICKGGIIPFWPKKKDNVLPKRWEQYMIQKICKKYNVKEDLDPMDTIEIPSSFSKW